MAKTDAAVNHTAVTYAALLIALHAETTATGGTGSTRPGTQRLPMDDRSDDGREFDELANAMYQALGRSTRTLNTNRTQALYLARRLAAVPTPEDTWVVELLDTDPRSPHCGDWITDTAVTGPATGEPHLAVARAMELFQQGRTTRAVGLTDREPLYISLLPWERER